MTRKLVFALVLAIAVITLMGAPVSAQQAAAASDGNGGVVVTTLDGKQVILTAATLGQLQVQSQPQAAGAVPVTGPVTPMDVNVTPGSVSVNQITVNGTTSVTVPVTELETKTINWGSKVVTWKDCKGKPHSRTKPGGSRTEIVGVKTTDKVVTGTVQIDGTPILQQAAANSKAYTDEQVAKVVKQVNDQRQTATIAVPIFAAPQQSQYQSQSQTASAPTGKKQQTPGGDGWCGSKKCKVGVTAAIGTGVACAFGWGGFCRGDGDILGPIVTSLPINQ